MVPGVGIEYNPSDARIKIKEDGVFRFAELIPGNPDRQGLFLLRSSQADTGDQQPQSQKHGENMFHKQILPFFSVLCTYFDSLPKFTVTVNLMASFLS